ncbi:hypothetical protein FSP39_019890 [Pinctada imbricata]|uniref:Uncharacterized protein n=1 Tax=Pinctada imbricata TaxID=66713 RepID=A0AA88Y5H5_PINIB|nr:hypothetical protein FSP39_019890 [Pinctada imbricata]
MAVSENRREFWQRHWNEVQKPVLVSNNIYGRGRWGKKGMEEYWEPMVNQGMSPKEMWQTKFKEVSDINLKFEIPKENFENQSEDKKDCIKNSDGMKSTFEQVGLLFSKPNMQEMQQRWETEMDKGKTAEEFWKEEKQNLGKRGSFWGWRRRHGNREAMCHGKRQKGDESTIFQEFDF